jgi:hypothetical protein
MIKVENNMLVLDSSFTKEDAQAINHFVDIAKQNQLKEILDFLEDPYWHNIQVPDKHIDCKMCLVIKDISNA